MFIGGDLERSQIAAAGHRGSRLPALEGLIVAGNVADSLITTGNPSDADASIGPVLVAGDWRASILAASSAPGGDGFYGTMDDEASRSGRLADRPSVLARIAHIVIGGSAIGSVEAEDAFGIVAQHIGSVKVLGARVPLTDARDAVLIPGSDNVWVRDVFKSARSGHLIPLRRCLDFGRLSAF